MQPQNYLHSICIAGGYAKSWGLKFGGWRYCSVGELFLPSVGVGVVPEGELVVTDGTLSTSGFGVYRVLPLYRY